MVIAVVAILAALLLPALAKAKIASKKVVCINNQKQFALGWIMYAGDHNDILMANGGYNSGWGPATQLWAQGSFVNVADYTNYNYIINPSYALMANYVRSIPTFHCPTDRELVKMNNGLYPRLRSYELNAYAGWVEPWDQTWDYRMSSYFRIFRKSTDIPAKIPAGLIYTFMDVNPDSICWPYFGMHMDRESFFNFPNASHNRGGIVAFADSHVEYIHFPKEMDSWINDMPNPTNRWW